MTRRHDKAPSQRQLRVGEELRHVLVSVLARGGLRDPALQDAQVTITEVRSSPDLRHATAFIVPFAGGDGGELVAALNRASGFLRGQLAHEIRLRYMPDIRFAVDESYDQARRIEEILHDPRVARDLDKEVTAQPDQSAADGTGAE